MSAITKPERPSFEGGEVAFLESQMGRDSQGLLLQQQPLQKFCSS